MTTVMLDSALQALARYPLYSTLAVLAAALLGMLILHVVVRTLNNGRYRWQRRVRAWLGVAAGKRIGELSWLIWTLHLLLWPMVAYVLLHTWGLRDEADFLAKSLYSTGVEIGGARVVLGKLLLGILLFAVLFTFTRWLKRKLEADWLLRAGVEAGTRDTVATVFGHVTFALTAMIGIAYAGVDLSKLAIVAGALSVGIGFGLQNIVSNFVSGLILLFERPVRSGDFISVGATEGIVRKMRIRATEIETPDRDTVIVPNSDLLSTHLRNRNLRTRHGRVVVPVGVAYGSDPRQVSQILLDVAKAHPAVIAGGADADPAAPAVLFTAFGASSLDFELRATVLDANERIRVASELRFAILEAFVVAGIEIPFPQQDVHVRALPAAVRSDSGGD